MRRVLDYVCVSPGEYKRKRRRRRERTTHDVICVFSFSFSFLDAERTAPLLLLPLGYKQLKRGHLQMAISCQQTKEAVRLCLALFFASLLYKRVRETCLTFLLFFSNIKIHFLEVNKWFRCQCSQFMATPDV